MLRLLPSDVSVRELVGSPVARRRVHGLGRFTAPVRSAWFWPGLWAAVAIASFVALIPVLFGHDPPISGYAVIHTLSGVSFAACGLIAWQRRPDSTVGRLLTATGLGVLLAPILRQLDSPLAFTLATLLGELWILGFVVLILSFVTGGRLQSTVDFVLAGAFFVGLFVLPLALMLFLEHEDNLLLVWPDAEIASALDKLRMAVLVIASLAVVVVIGERWRSASRPGRRALLPSVGGSLCGALYAAWLTCLIMESPWLPLVWLLNNIARRRRSSRSPSRTRC